jgi:hypothetical protein
VVLLQIARLASFITAEEADNTVVFTELFGGGYSFSNGVVRTRWLLSGNTMNQTYEVNMGDVWTTLADSGQGVMVAAKAFADNSSWTTRQKLAIPGLDNSLPPPVTVSGTPSTTTRFNVVGNGTSTAVLQYNLTLNVCWSVGFVLTLSGGQHHIHERLEFTRLAAATEPYADQVRVGKIFSTSGIRKELQLSFWRAIGYSGWAWPGASFVVQILGSWSPQSGGGAFPDITHWSGNKVHIGSEFTVAHQAPPAKSAQVSVVGAWRKPAI